MSWPGERIGASGAQALGITKRGVLRRLEKYPVYFMEIVVAL
jgi:hypothetical protein